MRLLFFCLQLYVLVRHGQIASQFIPLEVIKPTIIKIGLHCEVIISISVDNKRGLTVFDVPFFEDRLELGNIVRWDHDLHIHHMYYFVSLSLLAATRLLGWPILEPHLVLLQ